MMKSLNHEKGLEFLINDKKQLNKNDRFTVNEYLIFKRDEHIFRS